MELFSKPQRQSAVGILVLFTFTITNNLRHFATLLLIAFLRIREQPIYVGGGLLALLLLIGIYSVLSYYYYTFEISYDEKSFVVNNGIVSKTRTVIKFDNIQQVTVSQSFMHKVVGVYEVVIDTAGSTKAEVKIKAVSKVVADSLKATLSELQFKHETTSKEVALEQTNEIVKVSVMSLVKASLTSNYLRTMALVMAFFASIYESAHQAKIDPIDDDDVNRLANADNLGSLAVILIFFSIALLLIVNFLRVFIQFFGLSIKKTENELEFRYGLLSSRVTNVRPARVQQLSIIQNYLQKKMNISVIQFTQAGGLLNKDGKIKSALNFPGLATHESEKIRQYILGDLPPTITTLRSNWRKPVFTTFLLCFIPVAGLLFFAQFSLLYRISASLSLIILVLLWNFAAFRKYKLEIADGYLYLTSGLWDRKLTILPLTKIQAVKISQLAWHKHIGLASLEIETAGGAVRFSLGNERILRNYANLWLMKLESENPKWN